VPVRFKPVIEIVSLEQQQPINLVMWDVGDSAVKRASRQAEILGGIPRSHPSLAGW
jgi:hypothetical protein